MTERFFLDTNVLVYTFNSTAPRKQRIAQGLIQRALQEGEGVISYQVTQEFLSVALRKFKPAMTLLEAQSYLRRVLMPLCEVFPDSSLYSNALSIAAKTGWRYDDSLIVASAGAGKCSRVFSEDLQHGRSIRDVEIQNPFL